jgi:thioredoxin 1
MSDVLHLTDENFQIEVMESAIPVLVDFSAAWCGPCKKLDPIIAELAKDYAGRVKVAHVDVDRARQTAIKYGILSVPTVLYMKGGRITATQMGIESKNDMVKKLDAML